MAIDKSLLDLLVCPESRDKLQLASTALVQQINEAVKAGKVRDRSGKPVEKALSAGLVRPDGRYLYPVVDDIPNLIVDDSIALEAFG